MGASVCLSLFLVSCGNENLTHVNDAFNKPWEEIAADKEMLDEESHMATTTSTDNVENITMTKGSAAPEVISSPATAMPKQIAEPMVQPDRIIDVPARPRKQETFNQKNIFAKSLRSDSSRLDRLERAVQDMRDDFNRVEPSIRRLMAIEGDIQNLIGELKRLNSDVNATLPTMAQQKTSRSAPIPQVAAQKHTSNNTHVTPRAAPKSYSAKKSFVKKSAPPTGGQPVVYDIRVGEHPEKTRIVMDVNSKTNFSTDVDNSENILVIDLPNTKWSAKTAQNFAKSPFISSFNVENTGSGSLAIFQLKKNARVGYKGDLKGFDGSSRRLVIDISN